MTASTDVGALWLLGEVWGAPPEAAASLSERENLDYGKALITAANADGMISDAERDWILGYLTVAGNNQANLDTLRTFDGDANLEDLITGGIQRVAQRACISDAIRACGADGDLAPGELDKIRSVAARLDVPSEVVDELVDIYRQEQALKARRVALAFPDGLGT